MKIKSEYKVRNVSGENVVVNFGRLNEDMTKIIVLNEVSLWLWNSLSKIDFTKDQVVDLLVQEYGITAQLASEDADKWITGLTNAALLDL